jgi:hypothetical protein
LARLLTTLDERLPVANLVVGLQEYGICAQACAGLEAAVRRSCVCRYAVGVAGDVGLRKECATDYQRGDVAMLARPGNVNRKVADDLGWR